MISVPHDECVDERLWRELRLWYESVPGQAVLDHVQLGFDTMLAQLFGFYAAQIGNPAPARNFFAASRIRYKLMMDLDPACADLSGCAQVLPFAAESLDLVVLAHALDLSQDPHRVLREVDRVLVAEGHVLIMGFNPLSFYGLWKALHWRDRQAPWGGHFYRVARVKDWLALLGFDVRDCAYLGYPPPLSRTSLAHRLAWMEPLGARWTPYLGGVSLILARKRVARLTPLRPRWRPHRALAANLTEPSS